MSVPCQKKIWLAAFRSSLGDRLLVMDTVSLPSAGHDGGDGHCLWANYCLQRGFARIWQESTVEHIQPMGEGKLAQMLKEKQQ